MTLRPGILEEAKRLGDSIPDLTRSPEEVCLATFWRQATPGTSYWRCELPARHLPGQLIGFQEGDVLMSEDGTQFAVPRQNGAAVWQFLGDDGRSRVAFALQDSGVPTFQELDDNYLQPFPGFTGAWTRTIAEAQYRGTGYSHEAHRALTPQFDGLIVSTEHLANAYEDWNENIHVCPNSVDWTDWQHERVESDKLRIGYYASGSHVKDWPLVKKAIKWAARQPDVEVILIGFAPPGWTGRVLPWTDDLVEARSHLFQLDVGICPLVETDWAKGKSDVKALEYAMAGALPIVSRTEPYRPWHEGIGWEYVAQTEDEWMEVIRHVVRHRDSVLPDRATAKEYVMAERTIEGNIHRWKEALSG